MCAHNYAVTARLDGQSIVRSYHLDIEQLRHQTGYGLSTKPEPAPATSAG
jgi:hypothetical protein